VTSINASISISYPDDLVNALTDHDAAHMGIADGDDRWEPANCASCDGYHTVVKRGDIYFCANCFDWTDHVERCEWCNEPNTGDMEHTTVSGCDSSRSRQACP
jgi:hypothetical protein